MTKPFTDEDLKMLRRYIAQTKSPTYGIAPHEWDALFARLERLEAERDAWKTRCEAAENYVDQWDADKDCRCDVVERFCRHQQAKCVWLKAAGK